MSLLPHTLFHHSWHRSFMLHGLVSISSSAFLSPFTPGNSSPSRVKPIPKPPTNLSPIRPSDPSLTPISLKRPVSSVYTQPWTYTAFRPGAFDRDAFHACWITSDWTMFATCLRTFSSTIVRSVSSLFSVAAGVVKSGADARFTSGPSHLPRGEVGAT